jgi:nicotinamidase-related amidase
MKIWEKGTIIEEWKKVSIPSAPELEEVTLEPSTTALLVLDVQNQNCKQETRPRCVESVPKIVKLLRRTRGVGASVVYSLTRSAEPKDIREEVKPEAGEQVVKSGVDKFYATDLEKILEEMSVRTVILVGTSSNGAILHTATGAAARGLDVVVPVDCMSASDAYAEQYTAWHLVNAPGTRRRTRLTTVDAINFTV